MINKKEFDDIRKELKLFESEREKQIVKSREIIALSKQIIYSIHRDDLKEAERVAKDIKKKVKLLSKKNLEMGLDRVAVQEYVEAITFLEFIKKGKLVGRKELGVETDVFLLGLCDLTGELMRKAVKTVIRKEFDMTEKIRLLVEAIYGEFLKLDLRNGELRKKSDTIKWNMQKIEDLVYDIHIKDKRKD